MDRTIEYANLRREYMGQPLDEKLVSENPITQFEKWFEEIMKSGNPEPNAMTLTTAAADQPTARVVLLKGIDDNQFVFYTNYKSRKGQEIDQNPKVCLNFYWPELNRQVRIDGKAQKVALAISEAYFESRPRGSQVGAWSSDQSSEIASREDLISKLAEMEKKFQDQPVPKPPEWGGYAIAPVYMEFWQGREFRLHDRIAYVKHGDNWKITRLAP